MPPFAIETTSVSKHYGDTTAVRELTMRVESGTLFGIIGADGAGKTSLIKMLATLLVPESGTARVLGHDTVREYAPIRAAIGYMPQRFSLYEDLSVSENLFFFADLFGVTGAHRRERIERLLRFSRLGPFATRRARALSGGMKQKLALSCALVHTPRLLLLDEPTTGVDPLSRREFWSILRELNAQGTTIVVSTPYMNEAEYCGHLLLMHRGQALLNGPPDRLIASFLPALYRIASAQANLHLPHARSRLPGGGRVYPVAGDLHVAVPPPARIDREQVLRDVQTVVPAAETIEPITPRIEDLLFHHIDEYDRGGGQ
jgi:ABC-2 type transport system ATP-binding protein